jgi:folate-binding protein YgfZ
MSETVLSYGSVAAEYGALTAGRARLDRSGIDRLEITGADRQRFVNAYVTCDVKTLAPGQGLYGFFTNPQGRILAEATFLALEDRFWVELPPGQGEAVAAHLRKFLIADRVEIAPLAAVPLALAGPAAEALLGTAAAGLPDGERAHARVSFEGFEITLARTPRLGVPAWTLWVAPDAAPALAERLVAIGAVPVGAEALEIVRAEHGLPRYGRDFGAQNFPQETGIEEAVSYTKGCYLGQEVVARIHYRGGVQKALSGLLFDTLPAPGTALSLDGREVGTVTTAVDSVALGQPIGLAILHKRGAEPGTRLERADGGGAQVRALPFVQ